jgi:hypothetical protein
VAMAKWQQEWDQGDKGRATHEIIGTVDRRLRGWSHRAVCLLTVWHSRLCRTPLIFGVRFVGMGSLTVIPVENTRVERCGRISSEWVAGVIPKAYIMDKHLENQTKPTQSILMSYSGANNSRSRHQAPHLLLNNQAIPKLQHIRYLFQKLHPQPGRQRNPQKIPQPSQPPVQDSRTHPWVRSENPVPHLQILHPSRHRIPRPHLRHPIPCPPPPNLRLREKNAPQDLPTPRQSVPPPQVLGPVKTPKREANKVVAEMQQTNTTVKSIFENVHKRKMTQQNKSCLDSRFQLI